MNGTQDTSGGRCKRCNLSTNPNEPDFAHVRIGLDEAPEPLLCRCKTDSEIIAGVISKVTNAMMSLDKSGRTIGNKMTTVDLNAVTVAASSRLPNVEVEMRLSSVPSSSMFKMMKAGFFGTTTSNMVSEIGCSWWTGANTNRIARLRKRTNGETNAKVVMDVCEIMPGIKIAVSYEFEFAGEISRPEYTTVMHEVSTTIVISGTVVKMISRMYKGEDAVSFASEVEFKAGVAHAEIKAVASAIVNMVGTELSMVPHVDSTFMAEVRYVDHDVVDVADMSAYRGSFMIKADGMKVYVFCYPNGYVVTFANRTLNVISYVISSSYTPLVAITRKPDVMIAEMMVDGSLVYIDTLSKNEIVVPKSRSYASRPVTVNERPIMLMRTIWNTIKEVLKSPITVVPKDGIVCVTEFRTLRLKMPTVDLMYAGGIMFMSETDVLVPISKGHRSMIEGAIYEMTVSKCDTEGAVAIGNAVRRLVKTRPNNADIIKRAFASAVSSKSINTILYDITSASFSMRAKVYELAQTTASTNRNVIVTFGAGRLQELNEMRLASFSYIAVDPDIDIANVIKRSNKITAVPYDVNTSFSKQVMSITNRPGILIYYKGSSESFIMLSDVISFMSSTGIPAVFSFSISYHIAVINTLVNSSVSTFGCGFVHDNMTVGGVRSGPVTMDLTKNGEGNAVVLSTFGKSVWTEPILLTKSVPGLTTIKDGFADLWSNVDTATNQIMSRAVIMS